MTTATLSHVHASPLKPCAWAPRTNSSGNLARWSSLRRDGAPGGGLCLKPSTPSSLARFIHWLTAPSLTPKASAICACFQPRSFSSKARKRLPSRQSLAWLDNVFSIVGFVIPMSLDLYAEICRCRDGLLAVIHPHRASLMQILVYRLPRMAIPRTWLNKGKKKGRSL